MHYANGKPAQLGDLVVLRKDPRYPNQAAVEQLGMLVQATATSSTCNGQLRPIAIRHVSDLGVGPWMTTVWGDRCVTIGELMPIEIPERPASKLA
jgi:hypothetical protein